MKKYFKHISPVLFLTLLLSTPQVSQASDSDSHFNDSELYRQSHNHLLTGDANLVYQGQAEEEEGVVKLNFADPNLNRYNLEDMTANVHVSMTTIIAPDGDTFLKEAEELADLRERNGEGGAEDELELYLYQKTG